MVGRLAGLAAALALAAGCGKVAKQASGPLDRFYFPSGIAVQRYGTAPAEARLLVVSTNADLQFDSPSGGSVIALDGDFATSPVAYRRSGAVNVRSYGGDLALARPRVAGDAVTDPAACDPAVMPSTVGFFATRGSNTLNRLRITGDGGLECLECGIPLSGTFADPLAVAVACQDPSLVTSGTPRASVFIGYLQGLHGEGYVTEYTLADGQLRTVDTGGGPVRGLAYDPVRDRLYVMALATSDPLPLKYVDLRGCTVGASPALGGCDYRTSTQPVTFGTVELRAMALSPTRTPLNGFPQRAYLTARVYDAASASLAGARTSDLGGKLFVVDLLEGGPTGLLVDLVDEIDLGHGAQDVRVLPRAAGWSASRGDVVAVVTTDDSFLWLYDTETHDLASIGHDPITGTAWLGGEPYGLAVDPQLFAGAARVYVGSYTDSFVTAIDVPVANVNAATYAGGSRRLITGAEALP